MDNPTIIANDPVGDGRVSLPSVVVKRNPEADQTDMVKDTISIDQTRSSIRSYGAPLGSVDTPPDSIHDKLAIGSIQEPTEDYAPSASLQVHAGKDDESSLSEVDSAAAIRHKPWTSGRNRTEELDSKPTAISPSSRRISDSEEKVQAWLESTQSPDPQSGAQDDDVPPQNQQRRKSTIQTLKTHLLHGKLGNGIGKWISKNDATYQGSRANADGRQELEILKNSNDNTKGFGK